MLFVLLTFCVASHVFAIALLSCRRSQQASSIGSDGRRSQQASSIGSDGHGPSSRHHLLISPTTIRISGTASALFTLAFPYLSGLDHPAQQTGLRIVAFFYACKLLDLTLTKANRPPRLQPAPTSSSQVRDHAVYIWRLTTEMRYHSFDTAIDQHRPTQPSPRSDLLLELATTTFILTVLRTPETKSLLLLLLIRHGLETLHRILHPRCPHKLFYRPLAAASFRAFWTQHWHAGAAPFLHSLAYEPGSRAGGRACGVLLAFGLSGAWHAWASVPLVRGERAWALGLKVWALFVLMGVGCVVERAVGGSRQGGLVQKVVVWSASLAWAGWCLRTLQEDAAVPLLGKL